VAQEFGDHPETAVTRMCWARAVAREVFGDLALEVGPGATARACLVIRPPTIAGQTSGSPRTGLREPSRSTAGGKG
jgi:hypothetical protein